MFNISDLQVDNMSVFFVLFLQLVVLSPSGQNMTVNAGLKTGHKCIVSARRHNF